MTGQRYQHSGRIGLMGIPVMAIVGSMSAIVLGIIYVYAVAWVPIIFASFIFTAGFGSLLGLAVGWSGKLAKVRNPKMVGLFGVLTAGLGLYVSWAFDGIARFGSDEFPVILLSFEALQEYIELFYAEGFWSIGSGNGATVSGIPLAIVWGIEALMIIWLSWTFSVGYTADLPFCEGCGSWTKLKDGANEVLPPEDDEDALEKLCNGEVSVLSTFTKRPEDVPAYISLNIHQCQTCEECNCLTVSLTQITIDKDGKPETAVQPLAQHLLISPTDMDELEDILQEIATAEIPESIDEESVVDELSLEESEDV